MFKLFPIGTTKKHKSKIFFNNDISVDSFKNEISELLEDNSRGVATVKELQLFTVDSLDENKLPIIMLYNGQKTTISYRTITHLTEFTNNFKFKHSF